MVNILTRIVIVGFSYSDDYPPQRNSETYGSIMSGDSLIEASDDHFRNMASPLDRSIKSRGDNDVRFSLLRIAD